MQSPQISPFLEEERQKTDDSLTTERAKTNESIAQAIGKAEKRTDKLVEDKRLQADRIKSSARKEEDVKNRKEDKGVTSELRDERRKTDKAVEQERSHIDAAIDHERDLKNSLENKLLVQEREQTDKNLQVERNRTDSEVHNTTSLLSTEIEEHSKTKVSLTTRDEFLAIVSHDLRNPMGTIAMCAQMLLKNFDKNENSADVKKWAELIKRNADTSLRLISDILDMERIEYGKLQLKMESHNIGSIMQETVESFVQSALTANIFLNAVPLKLPVQVLCDRDRIVEVLSNLISNALKFTPEGGSVLIQAHLNAAEVRVSVADTGPGIPDEKIERIFDRFAQLRSKDRSGLGLGLYIAKMLIEAHRGELWVESKVGKGSTFSFTIPK